MIEAVVFDLDGVLLDTEELWDDAREELAARARRPLARPTRSGTMMGMSSPEWSRYMHDVIGLPEPPEEINREVVDRLTELYRERAAAASPGAVEAVAARRRWPLGLASSSNRELIDLVLELPGSRAPVRGHGLLRGGRSRQAGPDVYLEAARRLGVDPTTCRGDRGLAQRHPLGDRPPGCA